jgi:hypothetical protein
MAYEYKVLSPWAEADLIPFKGISARLTDLAGKKIGMFCNSKGASRPVNTEVAKKLKERFPTSEISFYSAGETLRLYKWQVRTRIDLSNGRWG